MYISPRETLDVIPKLPTDYDEPFSDYCRFPLFWSARWRVST